MNEEWSIAERGEKVRAFFDLVPHNKALGIEILSTAEGEVVMRLPWEPHLVGNPDTGWLHGGVVTALTDACGGGAVFMALPGPTPIATLDLRIDYLSVGEAGRDITAHAVCYKLTRSVAFVRCSAYHSDEPDRPIAAVTATYMVGTKRAATEVIFK